jgi:hydrogenase nickel incorporation protein HypA/HybF
LHEWALAEAVISAASEVAEKEGLKQVSEVIMKVGELQGLELDILDFAFSQLKSGKLKNAKFRMDSVKPRLKCKVCEHEWILSREKLDENTAEAIHFIPEVAHTYIKCPRCRSPDFEMLEGRGVWLQTIKGER